MRCTRGALHLLAIYEQFRLEALNLARNVDGQHTRIEARDRTNPRSTSKPTLPTFFCGQAKRVTAPIPVTMMRR